MNLNGKSLMACLVFIPMNDQKQHPHSEVCMDGGEDGGTH